MAPLKYKICGLYSNFCSPRRNMGVLSDFINNVKKGFESKEMKDSIEQLTSEARKRTQNVDKLRKRTYETINPFAVATIKKVILVLIKLQKMVNIVFPVSIRRKGSAFTRKLTNATVEATQKTAKKLDQTAVFKNVKKGTNFLKEELVDGSVLASARYHPYQSPTLQVKEKVLKSTISAEASQVPENLDAQDVVLHKSSRWEVEWQNFKDNNSVLQRAYEWKMFYDESDNILIRGLRNIHEKFSEAKESLVGGNDTLLVLEEIKRLDPSFEKEDFIELAHSQYIPLLLESYYKKDLDLLEKWCSDAVFKCLTTIFKNQQKLGISEHCDIREISYVDIFDAVRMEQGPVLNVVARVQQVCVGKDRAGNIIHGDPNIVEEAFYYIAFFREQDVYQAGGWKIQDFAIHYKRPMAL
jgi:hypothetical protein